DTEQQRLHPAEPLWRRSIEAERDQLVQPRHQHSRAIFTDVEYLRGLGVQLLSEVSRIEPVSQDRCVLPEHLVYDVVSIEVDRCDGDRAFGLAPAQRVRSQCDDVTNCDRFLTELAQQNRRAVADEDQLDALMSKGL